MKRLTGGLKVERRVAGGGRHGFQNRLSDQLLVPDEANLTTVELVEPIYGSIYITMVVPAVIG